MHFELFLLQGVNKQNVYFFIFRSADNCPTSLPQHIPSHHECYTRRLTSLNKRREIYSLKDQLPMMPYPRLNMSIMDYVEYLKTEPFLAFHAKLLSGNSDALDAALKMYKQMTTKASNIPQLTEYESIIDFFKNVPTKVLGVRFLCLDLHAFVEFFFLFLKSTMTQ